MSRSTVSRDWKSVPPVVAGAGLLVAAAALAPHTRTVVTEASRGQALWLALNLSLLLLGAALLLGRRRPWGARLSLVVLSVGLGGGLLGELMFRIGIGLDVERFRDPGLYAGWHDDEAYWQLRHRWLDKPLPTDTGFLPDPLVGWVTAESRRLDGDTETVATPSVLVYGDSFTEGVPPTTVDERIPALLSVELDRAVRNHAVSGYGIDQMYLRLRETAPRHTRPVLVVGLLNLDLDRALFRVRDAPKPRFVLDAESRLQLENVPLPDDPERWYAANPPRIRSFLGAFLWQRMVLATDSIPTELVYRRQEKRQLTVALLEATHDLADELDATLLFVLFYGEWQLGFEGWRERFLTTELERLGIPFVDTKPLFRQYAADRGVSVSSLYLPPPNQHPGPTGNRVVAQAIARRLRDLAGSPFAIVSARSVFRRTLTENDP